MTEQCDTSATDITVRRSQTRVLQVRRTRPRKLAGEIAADYKTRKEVDTRRKALIHKWRVKCEAVATSREEAGDRLFTFARLPPESRHRLGGITEHSVQPISAAVWFSARGHGTPLTNTASTAALCKRVGYLAVA